jgi:hypothetical protein
MIKKKQIIEVMRKGSAGQNLKVMKIPVLVLVLVSFCAACAKNSAPPPSPSEVDSDMFAGERHMRAALGLLEGNLSGDFAGPTMNPVTLMDARRRLKLTHRDFNGHRIAALSYIEDALANAEQSKQAEARDFAIKAANQVRLGLGFKVKEYPPA